MKTLSQHGDWLAAQKLELAARNLTHLIKINEEQTSLEHVVASLERTVIDAHSNDTSDLCDMMVVQARILDSLFYHYLDNAKGKYTCDDKIARAMKAQAQTVRTLHAWKKLKEERYVKHRIVNYHVPEQTRKNEKNAQNELDKFLHADDRPATDGPY